MGLTTKEIGSSSFNDMISSVDRRSEYVENRATANVRLNNFLTPYTLDNKSSILNAPCGYSNGVYPSLRPVGGENLLLYSNQFDTTWTTSNTSVTSGQSGYDGSSDAWLLSKSGASGFIQQTSAQSGVVVQSIYVKANTSTWCYMLNGSGFRYFDLTNGVIGNGGADIDSSIESIGNGWYRVSLVTNGCSYFRLYPAETNSNTATSGSIYIQDAQLEKGLKANTYIETTTTAKANGDFNFSRGSSATRVNEKGLIEDVQILSGNLVQNGDFEQIGSELVTNGDFDTDSNWNKGTGWSISGGKAIATSAPSGSRLEQFNLGQTINRPYKITLTISDLTEGGFGVFLGGVNKTGLSTNGTHTIYLTPTGTSQLFIFTSGTTSGSIDNVSVKEVGQNWMFGTGWSMGDGKAVFDGTTSYIQQNNLGASGVTAIYKVKWTQNITAGTRLRFFARNYNDSGNETILSGSTTGEGSFGLSGNCVGSGTFTAFVSSTNGCSFKMQGETGVNADITNVSVIEITDDTDIPRIDYTNGTGSLLLEPQSTNLVTYSEDFSQWSLYSYGGASTALTSGYLAPDGSDNAYEFDFTQSAGGSLITLNATVTASVDHSLSVWLKGKVGGEKVKIDLKNTGSSGISGELFTLTTDWVRYDVTVINDTGTARGFQFRLTNSDSIGTQTFYAWGAQLEEGSYATSYIPTSGQSGGVTRSAETCSGVGNSTVFNDSEGVLYAEIGALDDDLTFRVLSVSDGSNNNTVKFGYRSDSNRIYAEIRSGGSSQAFLSYDVTDITDFNKVALKYKLNDFALWVNGTERATDTSGNTPIGLSKLSLDRGDGGNDFYGKVKSLAVFKEALTDEELAQITSATQQEVFYEMRDRMNIKNYDYYEFGDYTTRLKKLF